MPDIDLNDEISLHLYYVGLLCTQWAYLERLLELAHWWLLGLLNKPKEGRIITGSLSIEMLAKRVRDLGHLKTNDEVVLSTFKNVAKRIDAIIDERNMAVHGVRVVDSDSSIRAEVARGKFKNNPQPISASGLRDLNNEVKSIISSLEPVLVSLKIIEDMTADAKVRQSPVPRKDCG